MKEITVAGAAGTIALAADGKSAVWTPADNIPTGSVLLTINGSDEAGNALAATTPLALTIKAVTLDKTPPDIDSSNSEPANGASGVEPAQVTKILITFTEKMSEAKLDSFEPKDAKVDSKFDGDKTLTISFIGGYNLSNEMEIIATVSGKDIACNSLMMATYSFTTKKME